MLSVHIPESFSIEENYALKCLLKHFLGLSIEWRVQYTANKVTIAGSRGNLCIDNIFFQELQEVSYNYKRVKLPRHIDDLGVIVDGKLHPLTSLYGKNKLSQYGNNYNLHADILGSTFFMLTRWEEMVSSKKDDHGRFPDTEALAVKHNFYHRPIVNEYVELLWALLKKIQPDLQRKPRKYQPILTCDVDELYRWKGVKDMAFWTAHHGKKGQWKLLYQDWKSIIKKISGQLDPYYNLEWITEQADNYRIPVHFFLKALRSNSKYDLNKYHLKKHDSLWKTLNKRGAIIGMHPSYDSFENMPVMDKELRLFKSAQLNPNHVRQHFLRFSNPKTWQIQNQLGFKEDSTLGFADRAGFRCGVCYPFPVFDLENRKQLDLCENPLLIMETPYLNQGKHQQLLEDAKTITAAVRKYNGNNVVLWHNSNLHYREHKQLFDDFLRVIS